MGFLVAISVYILGMIVFGAIVTRRRVKDSDDFMVAGRSLPRLVLAGTLLATWVGSGTIVGGASFVYQYGPLAAIFFFAGSPVGILIIYFFLARRMRELAKYTVPEVLEERYGVVARVLGAICILLAYVGIVSYQFTGGGYVLNLTTGIPVWIGTLATAAVVVLLAAMGGLISVAYTDAVSALLIVGGLLATAVLILTPLGATDIGGFGGLVAGLPEAKRSLTGGLSALQLLGYFLPLIFLLLGDQNLYQRFSAARDPATAKRAAFGFFVGDIITFSSVIVLASCAAVLMPNITPDSALLTLAAEQVPFFIGVVVLVPAVAIVVTTANSFLLSSAGNLVYDLYVKLLGREIRQDRRLVFTRVAVVALGVLAYALGQFFPSVLALQIYSYTMYGAAITPALLAAFLWRRATPAGGVASIVVGGAATLAWELILDKPFDLNAVLFALPLSVLALVIVSLLTARRTESTPFEGPDGSTRAGS